MKLQCFCLLAVFSYIRVAKEKCLDVGRCHTGLYCTVEMEMDFFFLFSPFSLFFYLLNQCHLDRIRRLVVFWNSFPSFCARYTFILCVMQRCHLTKKKVGRKRKNLLASSAQMDSRVKWKVIEAPRVHQRAMRLKLDFTGAGRQVVGIIKEGRRISAGRLWS